METPTHDLRAKYQKGHDADLMMMMMMMMMTLFFSCMGGVKVSVFFVGNPTLDITIHESGSVSPILDDSAPPTDIHTHIQPDKNITMAKTSPLA
jgi:hypothetical protein